MATQNTATGPREGSAVLPGGGIVCVTGASGFIGSHIVEHLLERGHAVRATVRDPENREKVAHLLDMAERHPGTLELHRGDLLEAGSFDAALDGAAALVHTAAVARFTARDPQREIVDPSIEGVNNVLSSVRKAGTVPVSAMFWSGAAFPLL